MYIIIWFSYFQIPFPEYNIDLRHLTQSLYIQTHTSVFQNIHNVRSALNMKHVTKRYKHIIIFTFQNMPYHNNRTTITNYNRNTSKTDKHVRYRLLYTLTYCGNIPQSKHTIPTPSVDVGTSHSPTHNPYSFGRTAPILTPSARQFLLPGPHSQNAIIIHHGAWRPPHPPAAVELRYKYERCQRAKSLSSERAPPIDRTVTFII
jgi:hypothetical protein